MPNYKRYWYVASPYTSEDEAVMERRYDDVVDFCAVMVREGQLVFSPIAHWHPISCFHDLPRDHTFWRDLDRAQIIAARGIMVLKLDGWEESKGVQDEIEFAKSLGREIQYFEWDEDGYWRMVE